ncbi:MAG: ABC transporter ATP-binding protein, partial [Thermodesulfovibrionales bacterium]
ITSIIGPNGAGKTTLFNCITGFTKPNSGKILFDGKDITGLQPHKIAEIGVVRTFQNIRLLSEMSVLQNVMAGRHLMSNYGFFDCILNSRRYRSQEGAAIQKAMELLEFMGISQYRDQMGTSLPYGIQKRLEIARALALDPHVILLDEPSAGMNQAETRSLMLLIEKIRNLGKTLMIIEHDMNLVMGVSDWIVVLNYGVMIAEGRPDDIKDDAKVVETYLGFGHKHVS